MFIDSDQVGALYNAVLKPEYHTEKISLGLKHALKFELKAGGGAEAKIGFVDWLKTILPFLGAEGKVEVKGEASGEREKEKESTLELSPIDSPQRQWVQLGLHYLANLPERMREVKVSDAKDDWLSDEFVTDLPRSLVFAEFPANTAFVPMAVEHTDGRVQLIYEDLAKSFVGPNVDVPKYPEPAQFKGTPEELQVKRRDYWEFFRDNFNSGVAMVAVEAKGSNTESIRWIDYRVPLGDKKPWLHLSVSANGRYHTGTFAYRWIRRGYHYGLRIVGTMKSGPAMNVLAVFER
jgi:hypothetical protein